MAGVVSAVKMRTPWDVGAMGRAKMVGRCPGDDHGDSLPWVHSEGFEHAGIVGSFARGHEHGVEPAERRKHGD
jgi:hypothetical protein